MGMTIAYDTPAKMTERIVVRSIVNRLYRLVQLGKYSLNGREFLCVFPGRRGPRLMGMVAYSLTSAYSYSIRNRSVLSSSSSSRHSLKNA